MGWTRSRIALIVTGLALVAGFFLPWIDVKIEGSMRFGMTGYELISNDMVSSPTQVFLALLPIGGALMALAALGGGRAAAPLSIGVGLGILAYTSWKVVYYFFAITGFGLWLILAAAIVAIAVGAKHHMAKAAKNAQT